MCARVSRTPIATAIGRDSKSISVKKECPNKRNMTGFSKERSVILSPLDLAIATWKEATKISLDVDMPVERTKPKTNEEKKERQINSCLHRERWSYLAMVLAKAVSIRLPFWIWIPRYPAFRKRLYRRQFGRAKRNLRLASTKIPSSLLNFNVNLITKPGSTPVHPVSMTWDRSDPIQSDPAPSRSASTKIDFNSLVQQPASMSNFGSNIR